MEAETSTSRNYLIPIIYIASVAIGLLLIVKTGIEPSMARQERETSERQRVGQCQHLIQHAATPTSRDDMRVSLQQAMTCVECYRYLCADRRRPDFDQRFNQLYWAHAELDMRGYGMSDDETRSMIDRLSRSILNQPDGGSVDPPAGTPIVCYAYKGDLK